MSAEIIKTINTNEGYFLLNTFYSCLNAYSKSKKDQLYVNNVLCFHSKSKNLNINGF